jgi:5-oxoprolinase (ATP-hydrolysing) subunit A
MISIDINCDMGEWFGNNMPDYEGCASGSMISDEAIIPYISSANIACGAHAGDAASLEKTIRLALKHGVAIGAHPAYPDRRGFGRVPVIMKPADLRDSLRRQIEQVKSQADSLGGTLRHVKPHGALYNLAAKDRRLARLIAGLVKEIDNRLMLFGLPGSELEHASREAGLAFAGEVFADRAYQDDGSLLPRDQAGAVLSDMGEMTDRVMTMATKAYVVALSGTHIPVRADTICIHGDNPVAADFVKHLFAQLRDAGIAVRPPVAPGAQ